MLGRKYELTNECIEIQGHTLYRIRSLIDFSVVRAGDLGGYIESEYNLSHNGRSWVFDEAVVFDEARVYGNAKVYDDAKVFGEAYISGDAVISRAAKIYGNAHITGRARIGDYAEVFEDSLVYGDALVLGKAKIFGKAHVGGDVRVTSRARVFGDAKLKGDLTIKDDYEVSVPPLIISGLSHEVVILDKIIKVGCTGKTLEEWFSLSPEELSKLCDLAPIFKFQYGDVIQKLAELHQSQFIK